MNTNLIRKEFNAHLNKLEYKNKILNTSVATLFASDLFALILPLVGYRLKNESLIIYSLVYILLSFILFAFFAKIQNLDKSNDKLVKKLFPNYTKVKDCFYRNNKDNKVYFINIDHNSINYIPVDNYKENNLVRVDPYGVTKVYSNSKYPIVPTHILKNEKLIPLENVKKIRPESPLNKLLKIDN